MGLRPIRDSLLFLSPQGQDFVSGGELQLGHISLFIKLHDFYVGMTVEEVFISSPNER